MDGLSAAASGMAVVSLAFQLGESIKQLHDFWVSIREAPDDIHTIQEELGLLSSVLAEMANEMQHSGPDQTLTRAVKACCDKVNKLTRITNEMEPGFASRSLRIRKWTAFKAVFKSEKIQKFQKVLDGLTSTLILAQQCSHSRVNRIRYQNQQQDLTTITKHLSSLKCDHMSATVTTVSKSSTIDYEHTNAFRAETSRICRNIQNPVHRLGFETGSEVAVDDLASSLPKDQDRTSQLLANMGSDQSIHSPRNEISRRARRQTLTKKTSTIRQFISRTFFGSIVTTTRTRSLKSRFVEDNVLDDEECQYEQESSFRILPAQWLLKLGFNYAYNFSTHDSSTQGWQWSIKPINLVPSDAPILELCRQGNLERVRDLFSRNLASVRDVDSEGYTPLHFAVESHTPELCNFLIKAGADKDARTFDISWSPLTMIYRSVITRDKLVNAVDTCRIFENSLNIWDENGDGWDLLSYAHNWQFTTETDPVTAFCSWFIKSSSPDIRDNFIEDQAWKAIYRAYDGVAEVVDLLLGLIPAETLTNHVDLYHNLLPLLFSHIARRNWKIVDLLLAWGADPHHVYSTSLFSPVAESLLSFAMYSSWSFWAFRSALYNRDIDFKDFASKEVEEGRPLLDAGWQMETLTALLELEFEPDISPRVPEAYNRRCDVCNRFIYNRSFYHPVYCPVVVQPYWQSFLESVKSGIAPDDLRSIAQNEQASNSQRNPTHLNGSTTHTADDSVLSQNPALSDDQAALLGQESPSNGVDISSTIFDRKEIWCVWCWRHSKETGRRWSPSSETESFDEDDTSEDEFSPYLIHT